MQIAQRPVCTDELHDALCLLGWAVGEELKGATDRAMGWHSCVVIIVLLGIVDSAEQTKRVLAS